MRLSTQISSCRAKVQSLTQAQSIFSFLGIWTWEESCVFRGLLDVRMPTISYWWETQICLGSLRGSLDAVFFLRFCDKCNALLGNQVLSLNQFQLFARLLPIIIATTVCRPCLHAQSLRHLRLFAIPWTVAHQALSMEFSGQEYWSKLPFSPPGDIPDPWIQPESPVSPALAGRFFTTEPPGKP